MKKLSPARFFKAIYMIGDQDECSLKHLCWGLAAIRNGLTWDKFEAALKNPHLWFDYGLDYSKPWDSESGSIEDGPGDTYRRLFIIRQWGKVYQTMEAMGMDAFWECCRRSRVIGSADYLEGFVEDAATRMSEAN